MSTTIRRGLKMMRTLTSGCSRTVRRRKKRKKRKKSEKCLICGEKGHRKMDCTRLPEERRKELQDLYNMKVERKGKAGDENHNEPTTLLPFETIEVKGRDDEKETR